MKLTHYIIIALTVAAASSCSNDPQWSVSGTITGADGKLLTLEQSYNGYWTVLDSTRLDSRGDYKLQSAPAGYPDVYRLNLQDGGVAYFPIDSLENITLNAQAATMSRQYELAGSPMATMMNDVNNIISNSIAQKGTEAVNDSIMKRELSGIILGDMSSMLAYYIINKEIDGQRIFNPANRGDLRIIGAVVNSFKNQRPNDPRTRIMEQQYLMQRRANNPAYTSVEAVEIGYPDITLMDNKGTQCTLSDLVGKGRPVIVNFIDTSADNSPAYNVILNNIYEAGDAYIYQVAVDADEYQWRRAAGNLPWVTVINTLSDGDKVLTNYNVTAIPVSFIIGTDGKLKDRINDVTSLPQEVKKY